MKTHPNVATIACMTEAALAGDIDALRKVFAEDLVFHVRGALPNVGDHSGPEGFVKVIGSIVEATKGDIDLEQLFCWADGDYAAEWERAKLTRNGTTLDTKNIFVYEFRDGRIAEMWMINTELDGAASFWA